MDSHISDDPDDSTFCNIIRLVWTGLVTIARDNIGICISNDSEDNAFDSINYDTSIEY